jgi:hypothetical protein
MLLKIKCMFVVETDKMTGATHEISCRHLMRNEN